MACAHQSDEEKSSGSESDVSAELDSDEYSDVDPDHQVYGKEPCKHYNGRGCRDGDKCSYLHLCKYALTGNCRYGSKCKLKHPGGASKAGLDPKTSGAEGEEERGDLKLTDGRYYQWQLNSGKAWKDVDNDHVLEAQYSLPHTKSIKIYNTAYGAVSIDFNRMGVSGKRLRVRRLDDGNTTWVWYCMLGRKWMKYGDKDSKGNPSPVNNADIENKFQSNPTSSYTFTINADTFEIKFREMQQVTEQRKRRVTRRPTFRQRGAGAGAGAGVSQTTAPRQGLSPDMKPLWQFEGDNGGWHEFRHRSGTSTECSVTSDEIERKYKQNPQDGMTFKVSGHSYKLDFRGMIQTNLKTKRTRKISRVMV